MDQQLSTHVYNLPPRVSQQATLSAHVHLKGVTGDHEALQQQHTRSVANQTVTFHLAQTQTSISGAALRWLPDSGTVDTFGKCKQVRRRTTVCYLTVTLSEILNYFHFWQKHVRHKLTAERPSENFTVSKIITRVIETFTWESCTVYFPYHHVITIKPQNVPGENSSGASGSGVHFVEDHVLQLLIIHWPKIDVSLQRLPEEKKSSIQHKLNEVKISHL